MIDKSLRKATAERCGDLIAVRMTGGGDCLWLNMYLDGATGQMTCDSDIGSYAYHWGRHKNDTLSWTDFCCQWLSNEEWLLRKCIGERHEPLYFDRDDSKRALINMCADEMDDTELGEGLEALEGVLEEADGYDDLNSWVAVVNALTDERNIALPDGWGECLTERYTPWQRRFAEICREVIVPAIRATERSAEE